MTGRFERTLGLIGDAARSIREDEFAALKRDCVAALAAGRKLIASGLGKNVPICEKFVGTLNSLGIPAAFMHTNSAVHGDLGLVQSGDLVIVLSKSGETTESIHLVRLLRELDCVIWLLSFSRDSALYREVPRRLIIQLAHEGDRWDILPNNSTVLNLIVLQELAMTLAEERRVDIGALRRNHPGGAIGARLTAEPAVEPAAERAGERAAEQGPERASGQGPERATKRPPGQEPGRTLTLSPLGHTWILDLDGTLVKHNGYKTDGRDTPLDGAADFLRRLPAGDMIVLVTSRALADRDVTEAFLRESSIRYDHIIYNAPYGERILINDRKPSGLRTALAICPERDSEVDIAIELCEGL
ncbi:MAG: SIS domain-containing protein [Peptococcaceae bacterium]|jgi:arabinose-5-phosphate isomerase|nr:SIS domain-containing protein [Peptococcaceae bacterium]